MPRPTTRTALRRVSAGPDTSGACWLLVHYICISTIIVNKYKIYVYIYIYIFISTYAYIYIYTQRERVCVCVLFTLVCVRVVSVVRTCIYLWYRYASAFV